MTSKRFNIILMLLLLLVVLPEAAQAQRKKKTQDVPLASGIKLREAEFYFTEGEKFFILEDYAKALLYYQRALEITPDNATIYYKIAEVLAHSNKQEDQQKAHLNIENSLRLEKKNKYFYLLAANIYNNLTKFDKAAETYETLLREVSGTEEYLYELAAVYQYANKPEEAIKTYNRAESILGINEVSSIQKQRLYMDLGKNKEAIAEGERLIAAFPDDERYMMGFAEVLSQKGLRPDAIQYLEKFVAQHPDAGNATMLLAGLYRDSNQENKARPLLSELFDNASIDITSKLIMLGTYNTELSLKKNKTADTSLENFVTGLFQKLELNHPDDPRVHIVGGDLYLSTGKPREAQKEYIKAIEMGNVNFEVWENLLFLETQSDQWDNVIKHADQALELFPNQGMIHYFNGYAQLRKRNYPEAIVSLEQAKRLSTSNPTIVVEINSMLGESYNGNKDYVKSDQAYDDALSLNPANSSVLNNYSYYLALRKANLEKAEKMSAQLIRDNPDNATFLDTYAWVLYTREKYKDARKIMERAIGTGKATATHFEHYGDILFKLGDVNAAVEQWEKARGLNANSEILNKKIANRKIYE